MSPAQDRTLTIGAHRRRRRLLVGSLVMAAQLALAGTVVAVVPERDGFEVMISPGATGGSGSGTDAKPGGGGPGGGPNATRGYDISYPQCGGAYPSNPAFAIVGVNGGLVYSANPCLASQIVWGGGAASQLYINTGNPGPAVSKYWPLGQTSPRYCDPANPDTADCAFDYGFNAARHSFETALAAYAALGLTASPTGTRWWLDVETSNSWRSDTTLNVAALQGEVAYLRDVAGITQIGFYSTQQQWNQITGGTFAFSAYPSWLAGALSLKGARDRCTRAAFTGNTIVYTQYPYQGFDANYAC